MSLSIGLDVIGIFESPDALIRSLEELCPQLIIMDECMPGMNGSTCAGYVRKLNPISKILIITSSTDPFLLYRAWNSDIDGLLEKNTSDELELAVNCVMGGSRFLDPNCKEHIDRRHLNFGPIVPHMFTILEHMANGLTNNEIAAELNKSYHTITTYVHRMMKHTGVSNKTELVSLAITNGWVRFKKDLITETKDLAWR